tara:strand:+ start:13388 stop:15796 length:2409 start_codon:yes stop_codon:yes gene_type:complete
MENANEQKRMGFYRGIIIQNNDPERRGRCKLFVPDFFPQIYDNWVSETEVDKLIKFPAGQNIDAATNKVFERLRKIAPWAEQASPLMGSGTAGLYSQASNDATISQASYDATRASTPGDGTSHPDQNTDAIGESPGRVIETEEYRQGDGFKSLKEDGTPFTNAYAYNYKPTTHSNKAQGAFSVPNVGAHVWVFFEGGNVQRPVYFAFSYGRRDWQDIYEVGPDKGKDYPGAYENETQEGSVNKYRDKWTMTMKGGGLEVVNTDGNESVNLTHHSGSFKEFNNTTSSEFVANQDQKLVNFDQFLTVKGGQNTRVKKHQAINVDRSRYTKIGAGKAEIYEKWKEEYRDIAELRALFTIRRAAPIEMEDGEVIPRNSPAQKQKGTPAPNPNTNQQNYSTDVKIGLTELPSSTVTSTLNEVEAYTQLSGITSNMGTASQDSSLGSAKNYPTTATYLESAGERGSNSFTGDSVAQSPSSQDGDWESESIKDELGKLEVDMAQTLAPIEAQMGIGGDDIEEVARHKQLVVGAVFNDYPAVRCDSKGKIGLKEILIDESGTYGNQKEAPLVERVANDKKFPCGNYSITVGNAYSVVAGSGGISQKTTGVAELGGATLTLGGREQVDISSKGNINLNSGGHVVISGAGLVLKTSDGKQVGIDGSFGIKNNAIIGGSSFTNGESYLQHITAPAEVQETGAVTLYGNPVTGKQIGTVLITSGSSAQLWPVMGLATPDSIVMNEHSHHFLNAPMTLMQSNNDVRLAATGLNKGNVAVPAKTPDHKKKEILTSSGSGQDNALKSFIDARENEIA